MVMVITKMSIIHLNETPIYKLREELNNNVFYIKRDDLLPIYFGGNKARKAILFFEDIKSKGADCVVTYGSSSSNHCRIISNIAASKGIPCYIISPNETSKPTSNSKMIQIFGAKVIYCDLAEVGKTIDKIINELKKQGHNPYFIQGGGHGDIGTHAYVKAYEEILNYTKNHNMSFDYIFHASGTGTTQAGLICGKSIYGGKEKIIGISIARKNPYGMNVVFQSVNSYLKSIGKKTIDVKEINFIDDYVVDGYGTYNQEILKTIKKVLTNEGIPLDPIYTGKAYWGMREYIKKNKITGKNILFIHTGGTPLFFDCLEKLL